MLSRDAYTAIVLIEMVNNLNIDWFELTNQDDIVFVFYSDGFSNAISFKKDVIWNSDDDEFDYEEDETTISQLPLPKGRGLLGN